MQVAKSMTGSRQKSPRRVGTRAAVLALVLAMTLVNAACGKKEQKAQKERAVNVRVQVAESRSLRPFVESIGTLNPYDSVNVSSELDGILQAIKVDEGSSVNQGQLLAEIKEVDYRLAVEQAAASLRQAEAALANVQQEHRRKEALYREELVTKQQFDDIVARLALAGGDVERARAGLELAKEKLGKTRIFSPMAGSIREKKVTAGDYIRNGTLLVSIIRTDLLKLTFTVTEKDVGKLKVGQELAFAVDAYPGREFRGQLKTIFPGLEEKTRSLQLEAEVANPGGRLKPGLFCRVTLYTGPPRSTVVVPINALLYDNTLTKLFVVEGDRARERKVKTGHKYGEFMEIMEGAQAKETVVTVGQNNLMEGALIHVAR
jgi:membrane fusion protein (multidrug efflux system)